MAVSDGFRTYVLEQLGDPPVVARAMFGGVGLHRDGLFFGLIDDDILFLKVDETTRSDFERAGSRPFQPMGEGTRPMQYYEVPADVLDDRDALAVWTAKALGVAAAARRAGKSGRSKRR